jgi:hypothetical protein
VCVAGVVVWFLAMAGCVSDGLRERGEPEFLLLLLLDENFGQGEAAGRNEQRVTESVTFSVT